MTDAESSSLPCVVLFNINGSGMGHLSRCLAYARRMKGRARPIFFSLASAIEIIEDMGFEADYFVSHFWSASHINAWNRELAVRFGMLLEAVRPQVVVFDGTWPFHGFMDACDIYGVPARVWSNRGLHKPDFERVPVKESSFDLVIRPGEIGTEYAATRGRRHQTVVIPPVTVLDNAELLGRDEARQQLGLAPDRRYALFSLGPGNLKDVGELGVGLVHEMHRHGIEVVWARAPISVRDVELPLGVRSISVYPLVRCMRAFDLFVGAAGYNTCCEILQAGTPSLLVPNTRVADDQLRRATMLAGWTPLVVSPCETDVQRRDAVTQLIQLDVTGDALPKPGLDGARHGADAILALTESKVAA
jgi:UDP-N-acetylglucosamine--N-acetylmuramyl-(pentapeptide) pyrophosphoryl-undecaprenol N-acetylglucosamine transferase